ncbi:MAG: hypothetical protein QM733_13200 [Ilumatobacteraceae bacterium]
MSVRGAAVDLASYSFGNVTSSYQIGACSATFYDVYPTTTVYPGSTGAGPYASSMASGWDNRVSSLHIP